MLSSALVYLAMLEFKPPHRPRSDVMATVRDLPAVIAAGVRGTHCYRVIFGTAVIFTASVRSWADDGAEKPDMPPMAWHRRTWVVPEQTDEWINDAA